MKHLFNMPKISFIVTSYNYAQYIEECIDSIISQIYQNIEIIIVDDHSRDNSVEVIKNIINNNKSQVNIRLIAHDRNKGQLASIFDGIFAATGEFIACIDSDDKITPDYALTHIAIHLFQPCALTVCELAEIDSNSVLHSLNSPATPKETEGTVINKIKVKYQEIQKSSTIKILDKKHNFFGGWWWAPTSCGVFRKAAIQPLLTFTQTNNWRTSPDKLMFNYLHLIGGSIKIYDQLVLYRRHGKNAGACNYIMGNTKYNSNAARKNYFKNQINLYKDLLSFFKENRLKLENLYSTKHYKKIINEIYSSLPKLIYYKITH